jgi:hypothetical protein
MASPAHRGTSVIAVLGAAVLLLVLVTWTASSGPGQVLSRHRDPEQHTGSGQAPVGPPPGKGNGRDLVQFAQGSLPGWVGAVALVVLLSLLFVALFLAGRLARHLRLGRPTVPRWRRQPPEEVPAEDLDPMTRVHELLSQDAEEERAQLAHQGEPRNAIVASWHRLEQQLVRAGVERRTWQTTSEFVLEVLNLVGADRGAVARLADLYREARFSDHPMVQAHRRRALEALDAIHHSLGLPTS